MHEVVGRPGRSLKQVKGFFQRAIDKKPSGKQSWDVWQWKKPKYRIRSVILLLLNAILFAGLGCFTFWLRTGELSPFITQQYKQLWWAAFDPTGTQQITLIDFLRYPIPVDQVPMMVVIVGLVLASLTAIPILVSMLYRFGFSLIFTIILGVVAVMPWMAFTVTLCCYLARWRPLQFSFRYATALISLLPLAVYYALSTRNASVSPHLPPVEIAKLYLPCVLAMIAACVVMAIVLTIARIVNYRPGAIAPLLAVMFAIPVVLFEANVGRDELYYRIIESRLGPGSKTYFADHVDADAIIREVAEKRLERIDNPQVTLERMTEQIRLALQLPLASGQIERDLATNSINEALALQKHIAVDECNAFRRRYSDSRYIPNVLYIQGRALDMRLDGNFFLSQDLVVIRHYQDFPHAATKPIWRELCDRFGDSPLASVAGYRLAMLEAREGNIDRAITLLDTLIGKFSNYKKEDPSMEKMSGWRSFLAKQTASSTLDVDPPTIIHEGRKLRALLANNRDREYKDQPITRLFNLNPHHPRYRDNLVRLLGDLHRHYPQSRLIDNIELRIAATQPSRSMRIEQLQAFIGRYSNDPHCDVLPRARFELGITYQTDNRPDEAKTLFEEVIRYHPHSPWELEANRRLGEMSVITWPRR
ncbi:MAG: tetratricopeptide repeat protein [Planctomycetota bacterium]|nr:MAG: tetratricopeptide repeat protein [Planctomycetota bacterium]